MKKHLILLHGAIGTKHQFDTLIPLLQNDFLTHTLNFSGHGDRAISESAFSISQFAKDVLHEIETKNLENVDVFGFSMGGYVAMYLARHYPQYVNRVFTLGTKYLWDEETAFKEIKLLDPIKIKEKIPAFAQQLALQHGQNNWVALLNKTAELMIGLGETRALSDDDFRQIDKTVKIAVGDRDNMVGIEETTAVFRLLHHGQLLVLPNTPHPFEKNDISRIAFEIKSFFITQ